MSENKIKELMGTGYSTHQSFLTDFEKLTELTVIQYIMVSFQCSEKEANEKLKSAKRIQDSVFID